MSPSDTVNRRVVLARYPRGLPTPQDFRLDEAAVPTPSEGQVLLRTLYLSLDPYMRQLMNETGPVYAPAVRLGEPMAGGTVNRVVASRHPQFRTGDLVLGSAGWQDYALSDGQDLLPLGFDACLDRRDPQLAEHLAAASPDGIDVYFENVGGAVFDAVLPLLNIGARVPVCGLIADYNEEMLPPVPNPLPRLMATLLQKRIRIQGFIILDHFAERFDAFRRDMSEWVGAGRVKLREDLVDGLENAPAALIGLLQGRNFGKLVVRVADA